MKTAKSTSARAQRVSATTPRYLVTGAELRYLVESIASSIECNMRGPRRATNTPRQALNAWAKQRGTWVAGSIASPLSPRTREETEGDLADIDADANMLRRLLPLAAA